MAGWMKVPVAMEHIKAATRRYLKGDKDAISVVKRPEDVTFEAEAMGADTVLSVHVTKDMWHSSDSILDVCEDCGAEIWRAADRVASTAKVKVIKVCLPCASKRAEADGEVPKIVVTQKTVDEAKKYR